MCVCVCVCVCVCLCVWQGTHTHITSFKPQHLRQGTHGTFPGRLPTQSVFCYLFCTWRKFVEKLFPFVKVTQKWCSIQQWKLTCCCRSFLYSVISPLSSRLTALAICGSTWVTSFLWRVFEYPLKWCTYSAGATWNGCGLGAFCVHHYYIHAPCHFMLNLCQSGSFFFYNTVCTKRGNVNQSEDCTLQEETWISPETRGNLR